MTDEDSAHPNVCSSRPDLQEAHNLPFQNKSTRQQVVAMDCSFAFSLRLRKLFTNSMHLKYLANRVLFLACYLHRKWHL